ncbi:MAG: AAA family ATPase [Bacteroidaceae bacterium]|nr:AAA family ATPase [Bacteroidaceae bacterium]
MGTYINLGNEGFRQIRNSEYIDKSGLIAVVNQTLFTEQKFNCVTRCRRFGKSMAAKMLCAYYDNSCDSRNLFSDLTIANDPSFEEHLNKYPVLYLDLSEFVTRFHDDSIVNQIDAAMKADVLNTYPDVKTEKEDDLMACLIRIMEATGDQFVFIIDEWDAICREFKAGTTAMDCYVDWLRRMFKGVNASRVFVGVYMTGILPIKKYKTQSALNNFQEYSMVTPGAMAPYFGFTKDEVRQLAQKHGMDFAEMEKWYDGYQIGSQTSMFNPNSVMMAIRNEWCDSYWAKTSATDAISSYINMNYDGLKDDIIRMLAGERCKVNPNGFKNDLSEVNSRDDVLTVLIHLGYLSYDRVRRECRIPNMEVMGEMENAINDVRWVHVGKTLKQSEQLLEDTLAGKADAVARAVEDAHSENTSILSYNDENSMACVLAIAYYYAHGDYIFHREMASGKGFADLVLQPRKNVDKPAVIIELKYGHRAEEAIDQIKERRYWEKMALDTTNILLVGIAYDREAKTHECIIEPLTIDH